MVYLTYKTINNKRYAYLVKSIRLPNGTPKKISKLIKSKRQLSYLIKKYNEIFLTEEKKLHTKYVLENFKSSNIFSKEEMEKIEGIKIDYKHLIRKLNKAQLKDLFDRFTINFTYESNAIEGNSLTLKDVNIVIFENSIPKGKDLREIYETRNSRIVVDKILDKKFDVSHKSILKIYKMLMKDIDVRTGYKKLPNFIIGSRIKTTPPGKVEEEMEKLISWYNSNSGKTHPLELASVFHGRFEKIHPFEDGNGRVGRLLINVILVSNGYPPLIIRKTVRKSYMAALSAFDFGYEDKLKRFLIEKYKETYRKFFEVYVRYAKALSKQRQK